MIQRCLGIGLSVVCVLTAARGQGLIRDGGFERQTIGKPPAGWTAFLDTRPAAEVVPGGAGGSGKCLKVTRSDDGRLVAINVALGAPRNRILVEFSLAFSPGRGRSLNVWSHEPDSRDASQINIAIQQGRLQQYDGRVRKWRGLTDKIRPSSDPKRPIWHRLRIVADRTSPAIDFYLSAPGSADLPAVPTATMHAYRTGLPFASISFASGKRIAPGSWYLIDNLVVRGGPDVAAPKGKVPPTATEWFVLWDPKVPMPMSGQCAPLEGVRFHVVKKREPKVDGYNWLHGAAVCWHKGKLYASFGHNKGSENTAGEQARGRVSADGGRTWSDVFTIDAGAEKDLAVSHGVFRSHKGTLWAFCGSFYGRMRKVHMRAYVLDETSGMWVAKGPVARDGFWPMGEPQEMPDGNWIIAGISVRADPGGANPAAAAVSRGDDFTRWRVVTIPLGEGLGRVWGESAVIVSGKEVLNISRWGKPTALAAISKDCGRTWTTMIPSNLPMTASKPCAGVLSTGQRYLVCTTTADAGNRRSPLTIAVGKPGRSVLSRVFRIRGAVHDGPGESTAKARLSYPYAVEHDGYLYVIYSNCGGRGGNRNSAELAVIPVRRLAVE